ncbi:amino acid ABC transporter substrate-binding protein (PAAT family) [Tamaricihabitans halophyticus]|uniref:Amino acid ABC transporter substrate-binding protein (PAAT family) n=1 Tax=Tamaricihabitans halophyticus TaxID=1262583 RepID=A0A4R2Q9B2_9PSEU|nr:glutamate ABC transporter substrate-binding protein [Tamaricihabitans halophyticus]TCP43391.1 amino acid ABC transporter substrate-binding protein (PAAT family) [Tamaricihabitans halophyticus]
MTPLRAQAGRTARRRLGLAATALVAALLAAACSANADEPADSLVGKANDAGALTIGTRLDQPGVGLRTVDGRYTGFDIDVATYMANELGVDSENIQWKEITSATRESALTSGEVDMVVGTYSITDERKQEVAFAGPYFETGQDLLVRSRSTDITGPSALDGKRLCSIKGSTPAERVKEEFAQDVQLVEYNRYTDCIPALLTGQVDAMTTDAVILAGYAADNPELLRVVGEQFSEERYGIGLRKGDSEGREALNKAIEKMITSGAWKQSLSRNIGPAEYPIPQPPKITER